MIFTLPAQSVAIRLLLGAMLAVLAARLLLRSGLQVPRIRVAAALVPATALVAILAVSFGNYHLPFVMLSGGGGGLVRLPMGGTYAWAAPLALPVLVGAWAILAGGRIAWRLVQTTRVTRRCAGTIAAGEVPLEVRRAVRHVASRMGLDAPPVGLVGECRGGATVIGIRRPVIVLDAALVPQLDQEELEGVIAHELAHIRRRDNLVALVLAMVRDAVFFVPGGRWALRQLLVERELAADQLAANVTRRPAALAAGLLKVLEGAPDGSIACAHLVPGGTVVERVQSLVDARPPAGRVRLATEAGTLATTFVVVLGAAMAAPSMVDIAGLGILVGPPSGSAPSDDTSPTPALAFSTYYHSSPVASAPADETSGRVLDDDPDHVRASMLRACEVQHPRCSEPAPHRTLGLRPGSTATRNEDLVEQWRAQSVVRTGDVFGVYVFEQLP